jgi:hypothetical protein
MYHLNVSAKINIKTVFLILSEAQLNTGSQSPADCVTEVKVFILGFYLFMGLPLQSSSQSFWLQIQRSRFNSRHYQIF